MADTMKLAGRGEGKGEGVLKKGGGCLCSEEVTWGHMDYMPLVLLQLT